jgi:ribose-phosphate pyrophosphokinase
LRGEVNVFDPIALVTGPASPRLGAEVAALLGVAAVDYGCARFADGEIEIRLHESVRGRDLYLLQATSPPVERHLMELLLMADACRRAGAARMTAVIPYFGYARQDRRIERGSLGGRVAARIVDTGHFDRLMLLDAHAASIEGFFDVAIDHLTAVPVLAEAARRSLPERAVVVAPDLGAVKRARDFARRLDLPMAVIHKTRRSGGTVEAHEVMGEVGRRTALIVDDMLSTGSTIAAAVGALKAAGAVAPMTVVVTHLLLAGAARERLEGLPLARLIAANSVSLDGVALDGVAGDRLGDVPLEIESVGPLLATAIRRNHAGESLVDLRIGND